MDYSKGDTAEKQRRLLQEYIFNLEEVQEKAEELAQVHEKLQRSEDMLLTVTRCIIHGLCLIKNRTIIWCNNALAQILGWEHEELIGKNTEIFCPGAVDQTMMDNVPWHNFDTDQTVALECDFAHKKGHLVPCQVIGLPINKNDLGKGMVYSITDISARRREREFLLSKNDEMAKLTGELRRANAELNREIAERQKAEEIIKASLIEKEVLLKEIHHRTRNNMQVICSLLHMQARCLKDQQLTKLFKETENRIQAMALVHKKLYQSNDLANIDLGEYIRDLFSSLQRSFHMNHEKICGRINCDSIFVSIGTAIPCGLIITELISNAFKYAFPAGREGVIDLSLHLAASGEIELVVRDNGIGVPKDFEFRKADSLGLKLVIGLAESQLRGQMFFSTDQGTEFRLRFQESYPQPSPRTDLGRLGNRQQVKLHYPDK